MYYFICYHRIYGRMVDHCVTAKHPGEWLKKMKEENRVSCIIMSFQLITQKDYDLFVKAGVDIK